ncbi:helix-turn-helix domain-containing protein [Mitsuokella multacida]|jgi:cytoskeletal protein RodZ|uniref:helix-turn-helix domain-containing protein n=1 Tax=Mitsuokella multacida TaxID=52226 RepID=UPI0022E661BA|nr:helix-turn-helix domain-containing protein [Mitsuokella multacida]
MLGDTLREAREKQGLTYKDIEKGTSIRALYIEYIEKGEYDELPGDVYTKGFIRSYANFLKLDANALVQAFTAERHKGAAPAAQQKPAAPKAAQEKPQAKKPEAPSAQLAAKPVEKVEKAAKAETIEKVEKPAEQPAAPKQEAAPRKAPVQPKATAVKPQPKQQLKKAPASKPAAPRFTAQDFNEPKRSNGKLIAIVAVVLVVLAGAVYALSGSDDSTKKPAAQQQTQQVEAPAPKTYDGVEVTATFTADCWLEVKADGKTVYEGTLKKGDSQTWKGTDKVTVRVGDAGAVSFSVNGKDLGTAGKTGQVANKTFTKDGN